MPPQTLPAPSRSSAAILLAALLLAVGPVLAGCAAAPYSGTSAGGAQAAAARAGGDADLQEAARALTRSHADHGWGVAADDPGVVRRALSVLLRGREAAQEAQDPLDAYLARLPDSGDGAAAMLAADLDHAYLLASEMDLAGRAALAAAPDPRTADADLAAMEQAAQTALRGAQFFAAAADALDDRLTPDWRDWLGERRRSLHDLALILAAHADDFAARRRAVLAAAG